MAMMAIDSGFFAQLALVEESERASGFGQCGPTAPRTLRP